MNNIESQIKNLRNEEEPYVGMPIESLNRNMGHHRHHHREREHGHEHDHQHEHVRHRHDPLAGLPLAMTYTPWQYWCETYEPAEALHRGTIFPELDLPFLGGGDC